MKEQHLDLCAEKVLSIYTSLLRKFEDLVEIQLATEDASLNEALKLGDFLIKWHKLVDEYHYISAIAAVKRLKSLGYTVEIKELQS